MENMFDDLPKFLAFVVIVALLVGAAIGYLIAKGV